MSDDHPIGETTSIVCDDADLTDLTPLAAFGNLKELDLGCTSVAVLSPLAGLTKLKSLSLRDTNVVGGGKMIVAISEWAHAFVSSLWASGLRRYRIQRQ